MSNVLLWLKKIKLAKLSLAGKIKLFKVIEKGKLSLRHTRSER